VRRLLKDLDKGLYRSLVPLLDALDADVSAALNVESHASTTPASSQEITSALARIETLEAVWTCASCGTRVWHLGVSDCCRCKCGTIGFPGRIAYCPPK
jgi:hypothetical protein